MSINSSHGDTTRNVIQKYTRTNGAAVPVLRTWLRSEGMTRVIANWSQVTLLWSEEFDTPLDMSTATHNGRWRPNDVWQPIDQGYADFGAGGLSTWCLNPNQSLNGSIQSPFTVSNSVLTIKAQRTPSEWNTDIATTNNGAVPPWCGGMLITNTVRDTERFGFGYYVVRARWPQCGKGMFPALWLFAANSHNVGKERAEIDMFEIFGYATGQPWDITLHHKRYDGTASEGATTSNGQIQVSTHDSDTTAWHDYALHWTDSFLRFYKDDVLVAEVAGADATFFNDVSMSLRLNYAMDAQWFPVDRISDHTTPNELTMEVDYVRVYNTKP